jgi:flagellar hook assembly protein FlgD
MGFLKYKVIAIMVNRKYLLVVFLGIGLIFYGSARAQSSTSDAPGESIIQLVTIEELEVDLTKGQVCHLRFFLRCKAEISVSIIDAYDYQVRQLVKNKACDRGTISLRWDGKDDQGNFVPVGAYIPFITAKTKKKELYTYDPRETTGWRSVSVSDSVYEASKGLVSFTLDQPAYVRLRIGSQDGPLYATLADWEYKYKGRHQIPWNGRDPTGIIDLTKSYLISCKAMSLPENVTYVIDSPNGGVLSRERQGIRIDVDHERYLAQAKLNPSRLIVGKGLSPRFKMELDGSSPTGDIPIVSSVCKLNIVIDKADVGWLTNERFESLLWIDGIYVAEDEEGYSPSSWQIDTKKYSDGLHVVTVMIQSFSDRIRTHSFVIKVRNNK